MFFQWESYCKWPQNSIAILHVPCACTLCVLNHVLVGSYSRVCTVNGAKLSMLMQRNVAAKGGTLLDVLVACTSCVL